MHNDGKHLWEKRVWEFPLHHTFETGAGLSAEDETKNSTIIPFVFQDNALVDYELIKTNPSNADYSTVAYPNVMQGSYVPAIHVQKIFYIPPTDTTLNHLLFNTMDIHTAMDNRLEASDRKTGTTVQDIIEMQHEDTDEQAYPLYTGTKLFETTTGSMDLDFTKVPGLTTDGQLESVAFDKDLFFSAKHYYTNKEMLNQVTGTMRSHTLSEPIVPHGRSIIAQNRVYSESMCKFASPYMFCGEMVHVPQVGSFEQYHVASETTAVEHLTFKYRITFNEYNPDFNFARA